MGFKSLQATSISHIRFSGLVWSNSVYGAIVIIYSRYYIFKAEARAPTCWWILKVTPSCAFPCANSLRKPYPIAPLQMLLTYTNTQAPIQSLFVLVLTVMGGRADPNQEGQELGWGSLLTILVLIQITVQPAPHVVCKWKSNIQAHTVM